MPAGGSSERAALCGDAKALFECRSLTLHELKHGHGAIPSKKVFPACAVPSSS